MSDFTDARKSCFRLFSLSIKCFALFFCLMCCSTFSYAADPELKLEKKAKKQKEIVVKFRKGKDPDEFLKEYQNNPDVIYAEPQMGIVLFGGIAKNNDNGFGRFRAQHGKQWKISSSKSKSKRLRFRGGPSAPIDSNPGNAAQKMISDFPEMFGQPDQHGEPKVKESLAGYHVRLPKFYKGLLVRGGTTVFHFDKKIRLHAAESTDINHFDLDVTAAISEAEAKRIIKESMPDKALNILSSEQQVDPSELAGRVVWSFYARSEDKVEELEILVDASEGKLLGVRSLTAQFDGQGNVFNPNPIRRAEALSLPLPSHGNDVCPLPVPDPGDDLTAFQAALSLTNLDGNGYLENSFVKIVNTVVDGIPTDIDYTNLHSLAQAADFNHAYSYDDPRFVEVNLYYHFEKYRDYLLNDLGYSLLDAPQLIIDAHCAADGHGAVTVSLQTAQEKDCIRFYDQHYIAKDADGVNDDEVCRKIGQSADPIIHELGHVIRKRIDDNYLMTDPAHEEGWADYFMASYTKDPIVGEWADEGSYLGHRRTLDNNLTMDDALEDMWPFSHSHFNGQIWGGALWGIRQYIINLFPSYPEAFHLADRLVLEGMYNFEFSRYPILQPEVPDFPKSADAIYTALVMLKALDSSDPRYDSRYEQITEDGLRNEFTKKGIDAEFPNDPLFGEITTFHNTGQNGATEDIDIDAPEAWNIQIGRVDSVTGRSDVIIGIVDGGVYYYHEDLGFEDKNFSGDLDGGEVDLNGDGLSTGNFWVNQAEYDGITGYDDDNNGYEDDMIGWDFIEGDNNPDGPYFSSAEHGTRVSSVVGAMTDNGIGVSGINWKCSLMHLRIIVASDAAEAIAYSTQNGAAILNFSWGLTPYGDCHQTVYDELLDACEFNTLLVTAAGNLSTSGLEEDSDAQPLLYPQCHALPNIINVTALSPQGLLSERYGKYTVDLAAPTGADVALYPPEVYPDWKYSELGHTSGAAPHVTGALGLLLAEEKDRKELLAATHPDYRTMTLGEIRYLLLTSVDKQANLENLCVSEGRLNAYKLLKNYADEDLDGYADRIERLFGTDPLDDSSFPDLSADSDGDGLNDGDELAYGTIPMIPSGEPLEDLIYPIYLDADNQLESGISAQDTDGDGLLDGDEIDYKNNLDDLYITDPANPDTDGDGTSDLDDSTPSPEGLTLPPIADGDVAPLGNHDGIIDLADVLILQKMALGMITPNDVQLSHGDVAPVGALDGIIDALDVLQLQKSLLNN